MGPQCRALLSCVYTGLYFTISPAGNWTLFSTFCGLCFRDPTYSCYSDFPVFSTPQELNSLANYRSRSVSDPVYHDNKPSEQLFPCVPFLSPPSQKSIFNKTAGCLLSVLLVKGWTGIRMGVVREGGQSSSNTFLYLFTKHTS